MTTRTETTQLLFDITRMCPAQKIVDGQSEAWHALLEEFEYRDCLEAARRTVRDGARFVALGDVCQGVGVIHQDRLDRAPQSALLPVCDPDDTAGYRDELARRRADVANGRVRPELGA
jgi:hypothetical protein